MPDFFSDPLLVHFLVAAIALPALALIARRAGLAMAWSALVLIPVFGWPLIGTVLALKPWPSRPKELWRVDDRKKKRSY
ncbi:hypothetical protein [Roseiterribacter gracilis]|uniref:Uncharacterized protein n=1 Tax=Roseiterribacter gracilis TaxID=2812848 RepID=A0A8S8XCW3_9PROT|nr:hypothetical protein TMPK1_27710 [Rhodospirillales bacterium TMPK1]